MLSCGRLVLHPSLNPVVYYPTSDPLTNFRPSWVVRLNDNSCRYRLDTYIPIVLHTGCNNVPIIKCTIYWFLLLLFLQLLIPKSFNLTPVVPLDRRVFASPHQMKINCLVRLCDQPYVFQTTKSVFWTPYLTLSCLSTALQHLYKYYFHFVKSCTSTLQFPCY